MLSKNTLFKVSLFTLALALASYRWVEDDFSKLIVSRLQEYRRVFPQEKAFLHTDKPYYVAGDTLWFSAYLAEGAIHFADSASRVLYVDLMEKRTGKNISIRRVKLDGGYGNGDIKLNDALPSGAYTIRAYTNWMRNFPEDYFFHKDLYVFNNGTNTPETVTSNLDVQFFPEGGQLVAGLSTRVGFKAIDQSGLGAEVNGFVLNQKNDTIAALKSEHLGMGKFPFEPVAGEKYTAFVRKKSDAYQRFDFPEVKSEGFTMIVNNLTTTDKMRILVYANFPDNMDKEVNIVAQTRGLVAFAAKGKVSKKGLQLNVPVNELPDGITQLTLFDSQNKPVCERLVFVDHGERLHLKISTNKNLFNPREKTEVEIMVTDTADKPVETMLSVSVTDEGQIAPQPYDQNIISYLLLSSDLRGIIEQPAYYFDTTKTDRKIKLDLLMMTQGWRRFNWADVLQESHTAPTRFVEQGFSIQGEVKKGNKKLADKVMLSVFLTNDSINTFLTTESGETGRFALDNLIFNDSLNVRLQGMNSKNNAGLNIIMAPFDPPKFTIHKIPFYPVTVDALKMAEYLKRAEEYLEIERKIRASREKLLKEITIKGKREEERDSRKLYSRADASIKVTPQMTGAANSILDMLQGRVAGVSVMGSGSNATVSIRGSRTEPTFLLDGMPVDKDLITSLSIFDVESIDVLKGASAAIYGSRGGGGVISVLTKRGNSAYDYSQDITPGVTVAKIAGFNVPRKFYEPRYDLKRPEDLKPDYRTTIHWAPMLRTKQDGKVKFSYFNTDASTKVNIRVEALTAWGIPGSAETGYSVR
ncbi:TonB-dependent outer membrane receptor, SusC/RagA subfamily, signature region [Dyadobacter koreensis]|uniref:TonB-dependent outer membrane receptor, SusC/RagA subfamily, signature region n=1 Tax=Dyadobacter koreensis TaxID=408657 RepID=A0A1H6ZZG8_9BACT|nr:TonB-dependent receptor plug domain-containing protein [Dyadobacter koreensis]SEJ58046.1 TonB-dependent outer membrane receptor, SusC/RagA subfamily, signature region [Dyadobacter koreensis]